MSELETPRMQVENKISLGNVLTILVLVGGLFASYYTMQGRIGEHEIRIKALEEALRTQNGQIALINDNINSMKQDLAIIRDRMERVRDKVDQIK